MTNLLLSFIHSFKQERGVKFTEIDNYMQSQLCTYTVATKMHANILMQQTACMTLYQHVSTNVVGQKHLIVYEE